MTKPFFARLAAFALAAMLAACGQSQQAATPPDPIVTVAPPVHKTLVDQDEYVGRFVAVNAVDIRARVTGYLAQVHFTDGQMVKQSDLLFTIDRRPFQTSLDQAKATLAQARANLAFAEADLARGSQLVQNKTITEQVFDQRTQARSVAEAAVAAQEAAVRQATLDLDFTELRAPVDGRIGDRRVSPGNLVSGNNVLLGTIVSLDPIRFEFTFDEASYIRYQRLAQGGKDMGSRDGSALVSLRLIDEPDFVHQGHMDFVDNVIDRLSGTIRGRAVFDNPNHIFTPGMFGRIRVPGSAPYTALLVPDAAIGTEQARKFVLVVDADNTVRQKYVTLGELKGDLRVIKSGIAADDRVIVNGLMRAHVGQKVRPQDEHDGVAPPAEASVPQVKN
ncbi:MAG TPA: efflux RND transporter periplasmic adaptor subunit [Xanthobacteraceae bacterium]